MSWSASAAEGEPFAFEQLDGAPAHAVTPEPAPLPDREALLAEAHAEADAIRERARAAGVEDARLAGLEQARAELEPAAQALAGALAELGPLRDGVVERVEAQAVELALMLAEKIVVGALEVQPERVVDAVRGALRLLAERDRVTLLVNPQDVALVREAIDAGAGELAESSGLALLPERRVSRGSVILRTIEGEVDACVQAKLERAREVVARELGR
ncbi:MAG: hypothetical protein KY463_09790 [Actinobacteria bacterium]|nr:hypothetical protein [Actinomycetota bacterium]